MGYDSVHKLSHWTWPMYLKPWPCSSGGMMVGRNSSMLLMAFCMTVSNTHNRGRHSSSISLVEDAGKYLGKIQEQKGMEEQGRSCRNKSTNWLGVHNANKEQIYLNKWHDQRGRDVRSAAFDQSLQYVVHWAAKKQRGGVWGCVFLEGCSLCQGYLFRFLPSIILLLIFKNQF